MSSYLKIKVAPRIDLSMMVEPNCEQLSAANRPCLKYRLMQRSPDANKPTSVLVVTFEGVLGSFLPSALSPHLKQHLAVSKKKKRDAMILRPGVARALTDLLGNFKVVVITANQSELH